MSEPKLTQPMEQYKREHWAAKLRVPDSGNPELDAMIRKAQRRDLILALFTGNASVHYGNDEHLSMVHETTKLLDALLATLSTPPEGGGR